MVQNEAYLIHKDWHIGPCELESLPYWQYEYLIEKINEINKAEEENAKEEEARANKQYSTASSLSQYKRQMGMNNIPNYSNFKMPSMPKI